MPAILILAKINKGGFGTHAVDTTVIPAGIAGIQNTGR